MPRFTAKINCPIYCKECAPQTIAQHIKRLFDTSIRVCKRDVQRVNITMQRQNSMWRSCTSFTK